MTTRHHPQTARSATLITSICVGALLTLNGCSSPAGADAHGQETPGLVPDIDPALCERAQGAWQPPEDAPVFVAVIDPTASGAQTALAPEISTQLLAAQEQALVMQVVRVEGPGTAPAVSDPVVLNPRPDNDSVEASEERTVTASCALKQLEAARATPATGDGSDIPAALAAGLAQDPTLMLVDSDGINTGGDLGVETTGWDLPGEVFAETAQALHGTVLNQEVPVVWTNLGRTEDPVPGWVRDHLQEQYTSLLPKADITFSTAQGATTTPVTGQDRPADELPPLPSVSVDPPAADAPGLGCVTIPSAVIFAPDSADLSDEAATVLAGVVQQLTTELDDRPGWSIVVGGHTADYGTPEYRQDLAQARAVVVAEALTGHGIDPAIITTRGYGSTVPADPAKTGPAADAANRRVTLMVGQADSLPDDPTC